MLTQLLCEEISEDEVGHSVKIVVYRQNFKKLDIVGRVLVWCLKELFGLPGSLEIETETDTVYYKKV